MPLTRYLVSHVLLGFTNICVIEHSLNGFVGVHGKMCYLFVVGLFVYNFLFQIMVIDITFNTEKGI